MKEQIFSNWYPMRWIVLTLGLILGYNYLAHSAAIYGILSLILLFQAVTNTGCLLGYCSPSLHQSPDTDSGLDDVTFEEIKAN